MTDSVLMIDMKTKVATMPRQPVITKDNITLQIQTAVYYRVVDAFKVAYKLGSSNQGALNFIAEMSQAALRSVGGEHTLQELLSNRDKIAHELQQFVENQVEPWGLLIENIFLKGTC
jgi:erythrocyte band 7 integral membrane protein